MVKVKIIAKEQAKNQNSCYLVFSYFGKERRTLLNDAIRNKFGVMDINIGDEINVIKTIVSDGREFYKITGVL